MSHIRKRFAKLGSQSCQAGLEQLIYLVLFNTAIAVLITLLVQHAKFTGVLLVSQAIGLSIFLAITIFKQFFELRGWRVLVPLSAGAVFGVLLGLLVAMMFEGVEIEMIGSIIVEQYQKLLVNLFLAFFFGLIALYFFLSREQQHQSARTLKEIQIKNLDHEKQVAETRLQLLQAQIEPHFLFNSLSNVISLIEPDPLRAKMMLESLTHYLRASLSRSQDRNGNLKDELDLIENYLKVLKIRMQERLQYSIKVADDLLKCSFPLMLLQPLVENAIKHGLEPLPEGGRIDIQIQNENNVLYIKVTDTGVGLKNDDLSGYGLSNIRQRLRSMFGEQGKLSIENNNPRGVVVNLEMPCE